MREATPNATKTILIIDTNVFLHYKFFDQLPWQTLVPQGDIVLAVCPPVLRELERMKFSDRSVRVRERAQGVVTRIHERLADSNSAQLSDRISLWAITREPTLDFGAIGLDRGVVDDVILACALEARSGDCVNVVIATADVGIHLKARTQSIKTIVVPEDWRLPIELSDGERQIRELKTELDAIKAAAPRLRLRFESGESFIKRPVHPRSSLSDADVVAQMKIAKKRYPLTPIPSSSVSATDPSFPMREAIDGIALYNAHQENEATRKFYKEYEVYLRSQHVGFERFDRTVEMRLVLENSGGQTADDVDVVILAKTTTGHWVANAPRVPLPPKPHRIDGLSPLVHAGRMPSVSSVIRGNADGPYLRKDATDTARFNVQRIKPGMPVSLPAVLFQFDSYDGADSFEISYKLMAATNMREPEVGSVHFIVEN